jgi:hypothetical protein
MTRIQVESLLLLVVFLVVLLFVFLLGRFWRFLRYWPLGWTRRGLDVALRRTRRVGGTIGGSHRRLLHLLLGRSLRPHLLLLWLGLRARHFRRPVVRTRRGLHVALWLRSNRLSRPVERPRRCRIVLLLRRLTSRRR